MADVILQATNLHKYYADNHAVRGISFDVARGEIFSLLGPNGAGKTTTLALLSCLLLPSEGDAVIAGHYITRDPMAVKRVIGVVPQEIALYPSLNATENLTFWGHMYGLGGRQLANRVAFGLELAGLADRAHAPVDTFSGGMKRRLNIAVGLLHEPQLLFLDEPTVGIDPQSRRRILDTIQNLNRQGLTVLYTTHYMEEAQELSDRIGIIDHGELIALGTLQELIQRTGGHDTLHLELAHNGTQAQEIASGLAALPGIDQVAWLPASTAEASGTDGGALAVQAPDAEQVLPAIVSFLGSQGVMIRRLELQEPNLEAVFLQLTGRGLRD